MKIGIDIDGTITKASIVSDIINKEYQNDFQYEDLIEYKFGNIIGLDQQEVDDLFKKYSEDFVINPAVNDNAIDIMGEWYNKGYELYIITARPKDEHDLTLDWLNRMGVQFKELHVLGGMHKEDIVGSKGIDVFIEDIRETILRVEASVPETINVLIDTPYNQGSLSNNSKRVGQWNEIQELVNQLESRTVKQ